MKQKIKKGRYNMAEFEKVVNDSVNKWK